MSNVRIIARKRHVSRAWERSPYWQTVLMKRFESSPEDDYGSVPESLKMPTTRAGLNAMRWEMRKSIRGRHRTKTVHHEKFMKRLLSGIADLTEP